MKKIYLLGLSLITCCIISSNTLAKENVYFLINHESKEQLSKDSTNFEGFLQDLSYIKDNKKDSFSFIFDLFKYKFYTAIPSVNGLIIVNSINGEQLLKHDIDKIDNHHYVQYLTTLVPKFQKEHKVRINNIDEYYTYSSYFANFHPDDDKYYLSARITKDQQSYYYRTRLYPTKEFSKFYQFDTIKHQKDNLELINKDNLDLIADLNILNTKLDKESMLTKASNSIANTYIDKDFNIFSIYPNRKVLVILRARNGDLRLKYLGEIDDENNLKLVDIYDKSEQNIKLTSLESIAITIDNQEYHFYNYQYIKKKD